MKRQSTIIALVFSLLAGANAIAQENQTIFKNAGIHRSGGYAAISNKFTSINGSYANMPSVYGGWFVNQKWMLGLSLGATTNYIPVPAISTNFPARKMTYQYGQAGLMNEYVIGSTKKVHVAFNLFTGAGFTLQYDRLNDDNWDMDHDEVNAHVFFVAEPGVQVEFNLLRWMRFSPGISYRKAFGVDDDGLTNSDLSNISYNVTLKFGKF